MPITDVQRLRRMVGDRVPPGEDEGSCFFSDDEIRDLLSRASNDFNTAAFHGWLDKMAEFAKLIDRNISGADMRLSQMYKNAEGMARHYGELANADVAAIMGRVVGRAVNLREYPCAPRVMTGSGTFRSELASPEHRTLLALSAPETVEEDPTYPQPGQEAS